MQRDSNSNPSTVNFSKAEPLSISKIGTDSELKHFSSKGFKFKDSFIKTFSKLSGLSWRVASIDPGDQRRG